MLPHHLLHEEQEFNMFLAKCTKKYVRHNHSSQKESTAIAKFRKSFQPVSTFLAK